ncbi:MAG: hypothetical protein V3V25_13245 [Paracoccaceae bacterium]
MTSVKAALLFVGNPTLAIEHFVESLNVRLAVLGYEAEEVSPETGSLICFRAEGVTVTVSCKSTPMPAEYFKDSLLSPLSKPMIGVLAETLSHHTRHMMVSVSENTADDKHQSTLLTRLQLAHATTCQLAQWHIPAAVHWQQSNQLLTGAQYLELNSETTPWALFARAKIIPSAKIDQMVRSHSLELADTIDFIGRPIHFRESDLPVDEMHAVALSFLRNAVVEDSSIAHGDTFGPKGGNIYRVTYIDAFEDMPNGMFELSVVQKDADTALGGPARPSKATVFGSTYPDENKRSFAISFLMLAVLPPVGALLLVSNIVFGSNVWRTGMVALASVALAVLVGTYAFMNSGLQTTALLAEDFIQSSVLPN